MFTLLWLKRKVGGSHCELQSDEQLRDQAAERRRQVAAL